MGEHNNYQCYSIFALIHREAYMHMNLDFYGFTVRHISDYFSESKDKKRKGKEAIIFS